jgi:hypothetical protein
MKARPGFQLSRRLLLGGGASLLGLPFLESLVPRAARAQAAAAPVRLIYFYVPNGLDMATFRPTSPGADYTLPPMLASLAPLKGEFSVVTGLENVNARPDMVGDHASGTSGFITCIHANKSETDISLGISADQVAAQKLGSATILPSLQLGLEGGGSAGGCDSGYSCAYSRNVSWADAKTPLPKIINPKQAFDRLFEGYDPNASAAEAEKRRAYEKSVIDAVLGDVTSLQPKLGATDQKKLDQYLTGVRELEKQVAGLDSGARCSVGAAPPSNDGLAYPDHLKAMMDVVVLAMSCDRTRIVTLMIGNAGSNRSHPFLGISGAHHEISHHQNDAGQIALLAKIGEWEMQQFGYLLDKLKAAPDSVEGQNVLHNSAIFMSSEISDGNRHNHDDMPILLAGRAGGAFNPGRHINYAVDKGSPKEKVSNLLVSMLEAAGVAGAQLGDSTGPLTGI